MYPVDETWFYRRNTPDIGNNQTDPKVGMELPLLDLEHTFCLDAGS